MFRFSIDTADCAPVDARAAELGVREDPEFAETILDDFRGRHPGFVPYARCRPSRADIEYDEISHHRVYRWDDRTPTDADAARRLVLEEAGVAPLRVFVEAPDPVHG